MYININAALSFKLLIIFLRTINTVGVGLSAFIRLRKYVRDANILGCQSDNAAIGNRWEINKNAAL